MATGHAQPPSHGTLKVPGARLRFEVHGAGEPVVLIMGFGMPGAAWRNQVPTLAARHRVVHFDNRGAGATESTAGAYSMGLFAQDTLALMDHLGMQRAHVVGVSMGGMIAQELALRARPRVRSLTLIATHAGGLRAVLPPRGGLSLFFGALRGKGPKARLEAVERLLFPRSTSPPATAPGCAASLRRTSDTRLVGRCAGPSSRRCCAIAPATGCGASTACPR